MQTASRLFLIGFDGMNFPLLKRFIEEGVLPTFAALANEGSLNRVLPSIPAWTPTNWSSVATGGTVGTHRLGGWTVRDKSADWSEPRTMAWDAASYDGAEALWDVADRLGRRSLLTHYPAGTWNAELKNAIIVAPGVHDAPFSLSPAMSYFAGKAVEAEAISGTPAPVRTIDVEEQGATPGSSRVRLEVSGDSTDWSRARLPVAVRDSSGDALYLSFTMSPDLKVWISPDAERGDAGVRVPLEGWSEFIHWRVGANATPCAVRFALLDYAHDGSYIHVVRSPIYALEGFTSPPEFSAEIIARCGPFYDLYSVEPEESERHLDLWLDEMRLMGEWQAGVAHLVDEDPGWDLHMSHWHAFDWINHATGNGLDPAGPEYDPNRAEWLLHAQRRTYQLADEILARFLDVRRSDDLVCVMSDHGITATHRYADVAARLEEVGLLARASDGAVDLRRSRVYFMEERGAEIFINLAGREPHGLVAPDDYAAVRSEVIDALLDWRDPRDNSRICAIALTIDDAPVLGWWGPTSGDVIYVLNRGFGWGRPVEGGSIGTGRLAIHGSQVPTSETAELSNLGSLLMVGPGVRRNYQRDWSRWGHMRMVDVAPTCAYLTGMPMLRHSTGAILSDMLDF